MGVPPQREKQRIGRSKYGSIVLTLGLCVISPAAAQETAEEKPRGFFERGEFRPTFSLHGFADFNLFADDNVASGDSEDHRTWFAVGEFDLYMVSHLAPNLSFLGELVFELDDDGKAEVDLERVFLKYTVSDLFSLKAGRIHTPLGYWNESFHHGRLLEPTVDRPLVMQFEDRGGILPIHTVGLAANGRWFRGSWTFEYDGGLFNGRGSGPEQIRQASDLNDNKGLLLKLSLRRTGRSAIIFGPSFYRDLIPPDVDLPGRDGEIDESILGGHFVFTNDRLNLMSEYYRIRHDDEVASTIFDHTGWYAVAIWQQWKWKPYAGYDRLELDNADGFFAGIDPDQRRFLAGLRWDFSPFATIKVEYRRLEISGANGNGLAVQAAYTF